MSKRNIMENLFKTLVVVTVLAISACDGGSGTSVSADTPTLRSVPGTLEGTWNEKGEKKEARIPVTLRFTEELTYGSDGKITLGKDTCLRIEPPSGYVLDSMRVTITGLSNASQRLYSNGCGENASVHKTLNGNTITKIGGEAEFRFHSEETIEKFTAIFDNPSTGEELEVVEGKFFAN